MILHIKKNHDNSFKILIDTDWEIQHLSWHDVKGSNCRLGFQSSVWSPCFPAWKRGHSREYWALSASAAELPKNRMDEETSCNDFQGQVKIVDQIVLEQKRGITRWLKYASQVKSSRLPLFSFRLAPEAISTSPKTNCSLPFESLLDESAELVFVNQRKLIKYDG